MKNIYFVRHAKSSWTDPSLRDIERPLNKRGFRDAPFMAKKLKDVENPKFGALFSSPAKRALTTANFFSDTFHREISVESFLYEADTEDIIEFLQGLDDHLETVAVFGHNPTFTYFANQFSEQPIENVPTCGIFRITTDIDSWGDFDRDNGKLTAFFYPKQFL